MFVLKQGTAEAWNDLFRTRTGLGATAIDFAVKWGTAIEKEMANGHKLEDVANRCRWASDDEGLPGSIQGASIRLLCQFWQHGEAFRRWHNVDCGESPDAEGVVDPNVLVLRAD